MVEESNVSSFRYKDADLRFTITSDETESEFDKILREKWERAEENGVLRYNLRITEWKILEGSYKFLAQLNPDRGSSRRKPQDISSMSQPFNADGFNFTKIPAREIFLDIGDGTGNDVIAANISPIERGHYLFLPDRLRCLPQKMTKSSLVRAMELLLLSNSKYFRVIFNSLCAYASVNHLHWHLYYLKHEMLLENIALDKLKGPIFTIKDYPAKGFCLKQSLFAEENFLNIGEWAFFVINYLQEKNVPHNVYITRAKNDDSDRHEDIRVYIWARKASDGVKDLTMFVPAVSELFGHLGAKSEEEYKNLTEEKVSQILNDVTEYTFAEIKESLKDAIENKMAGK